MNADKKIKMYGGDVTLNFNEKLHTYWVEGNNGEAHIVPSMSSVLSAVINKSAPLMQWSANCAVDAMLAGKTPEEARIAYKNVSEEATDVGTIAHTWMENFWTHPGVPPALPDNQEAANSVDAFMEWLSKNKVKPLATEKLLYSKRYKVAGTTDLIALVNDRLTVIDYKTSKRLYNTYNLQTAGYVYMLKEECAYAHTHHKYYGFINEDFKSVFNYKDPIYRLVIRVGKDGKLEFLPKETPTKEENRLTLKRDMNAMLHAVSLHHWLFNQELTKPKQKELDEIRWTAKYNFYHKGKLF